MLEIKVRQERETRLAGVAPAIISWQRMVSLIRRHLDKNSKVVKE